MDKFANKAITFIWVTSEGDSTLMPWLSQHGMRGWVLYDQDGGMGAAYGFELPGSVFVGKDRKILGFHNALPPGADFLNAVLEGRVTTMTPGKTTMKASAQRNLVLLESMPRILPHMGVNKLDFPPSYVLHVAPSQREGMSNAKGPDFWSLQGYEFADVIAELYGVNPNHIQLPPSLNNHKRYDMSLVCPKNPAKRRCATIFGKHSRSASTSRPTGRIAWWTFML